MRAFKEHRRRTFHGASIACGRTTTDVSCQRMLAIQLGRCYDPVRKSVVMADLTEELRQLLRQSKQDEAKEAPTPSWQESVCDHGHALTAQGPNRKTRHGLSSPG